MPIKSKSAFLRGPNDLRVVEVDVPTPEPNQVLIKMGACGICGSDRECFEGKSPEGRFDLGPCTPGHERGGPQLQGRPHAFRLPQLSGGRLSSRFPGGHWGMHGAGRAVRPQDPRPVDLCRHRGHPGRGSRRDFGRHGGRHRGSTVLDPSSAPIIEQVMKATGGQVRLIGHSIGRRVSAELGRTIWHTLSTHHFPFSRLHEAMETAIHHTSSALKVMLDFD